MYSVHVVVNIHGSRALSPGQTKKHCCVNIMFPTNVFLFSHLGKHCCGNNICFPGSKNACCPTNSETFLLQKQCFSVFPHVFKCFQHKKHCFPDQAILKNVLWL